MITKKMPFDKTALHALVMGGSLCLLSACASIGEAPAASGPRLNSAVAACMAATGRSDLLLMKVPDAGSAVATKIAAVSVAVSGSNSVDALVNMLSPPQPRGMIVSGDNDELTAATIRAALNKLKPIQGSSPVPVCFTGDAKYIPDLKIAGAHVGVAIFGSTPP